MKPFPVLSLVVALSLPGIVLGNPYDAESLDPTKADERERLLKMVSEPTGGYHHSAAQKLVKAGYVNELLGFLKETESIGTMQAVAAATGAASIPVFRDRLREEPDNLALVWATSLIRSPKIAPILLEIVRNHPEDSGDSEQKDMLGYALHGLRNNLCVSALDVLRERFEKCDKKAANRKAHYALSLFWLGDPRGVDYMVAHLESDLRKGAPSGESWLVHQLARHFWLGRLKKNPHLPDLATLEPMLPVLVRGATSADRLFISDWGGVFSTLTLYPYPTEHWTEWLEDRNRINHPIYSQALDQVVAKAVEAFQTGMDKIAKNSAIIADMMEQGKIRPPENARQAVYHHLFHFDSNARYGPDGVRRSEEAAAEFDLQFYIGHTTRLLDQAPPLFRKDFKELDISVVLITSNEDPAIQNTLVAQARKVCAPFEEYIKGGAGAASSQRVKSAVDLEGQKIEPVEKKPAQGTAFNQGRAAVKVEGEFTVAPFKVGAAVSGTTNRYRWTEIPAAFREKEFFFTQFDFRHQGVTEFDIRSDGKVYLAVTSRWGKGGNSSGGWRGELISKEEFLAEGWKEVAKIGEARGDASHGYRWTIYERECQKGEQFRLRTEKYCAPILLF